MFSRTFVRTILGAAFATTLLVPAAHARTSAANVGAALDPAIAAAIHDRAIGTAVVPLDPAIAAAIHDRAIGTAVVPLDPAIAAAIHDRAIGTAVVPLDPAIAAAIHDRAIGTAVVPFDPAIAAASKNRTATTLESVALDPAIRAGLLERASASTRPDDRSGARGVGSLPQPDRETRSVAVEWSFVGIGGAVTLAALLALGSLLLIRHGRARVTSA
jgi:hypothetical protein